MREWLISRELEEYAIEMRRYFHCYPELSEEEAGTQKRICEELEKINIPYTCVPTHQVVAQINGNKSGKRIALRADIDALPMQEESELSFRSRHDGVAHTCGHDAHTAILLAAAKYLSTHKDEWSGTVLLCFQGSEEIGGHGACELIPYLNGTGGADHALGLHVEPMLSTGQIAAIPGARAAGSIGFHATIMGMGGHGSRPDRSLDPILPACEAVQKISAIPANRNCALEPLVVNVGCISAGNAYNAVPEIAEFAGSIRYFNPDLPQKVLPMIRRMIEGTAESYGETAKVEFENIAYPLVNSQEACTIAEKIISETEGFSMGEIEPDMGSDDFCEFSSAYGGLYALLGTTSDPEKRYPLHHPKYHLDEDSIKYGVEFTVRYVVQYLSDGTQIE